MFTLKKFIKKGLIDAIGNLPSYQIVLNASGWFEKGVLDEMDLADINAEIESRYTFKAEQ